MRRNFPPYRYRALLLAATAMTFSMSAARAQWTAPTTEELKMTSQPQVSGASAVYLDRDELIEGVPRIYTVYAKIKVLDEAGKKFGEVSLHYPTDTNHSGYSVTDIQGRTIHADGTIIPFTGQAEDKLIENEQGVKVAAKVFSLPDVQVGSILEYRYKIHYDETVSMTPYWMVQSELYTRKAHFLWKPAGNELMKTTAGTGYGPPQRGGGGDSDGPKVPPSVLAWAPFLPKDAEVKQSNMPGGMTGLNAGARTLELNIHDIPALPKEEYMPPYESLAYRVNFYYSAYHGQEEFWKGEGATWSKAEDVFIGSDSAIAEAVQSIVGLSDPQELKLKKIYASVMNLENTDFTPDHGVAGDKAEGQGMAKSAAEIWRNKKGNSNQIAELFVALARAAQLKAYVMAVPDRGEHIFLPGYLSLSQLTDKIAIVSVGGRDQFFDPGERYCAYGHLAWHHSLDHGLRQMEGGETSIAQETPGEAYKDSRTQRAADLTMDKDGSVSGPLTLIFTGSPALEWRQRALTTDDAGIRSSLKTAVEHMLPAGMNVQVISIDKLTDYESPLTIHLTAKGNLGSNTGKQIILPADPFEATAVATFSQEKREQPIYFHYGSSLLDAMRVKFPAGFTVESVPAVDKGQYLTSAVYSLTSESTPTSVTIRHAFDITDILFSAKEYLELRGFYSKMEQKSHESVVLKIPATAAGN